MADVLEYRRVALGGIDGTWSLTVVSRLNLLTTAVLPGGIHVSMKADGKG